ncbi:MAG TPA: HD domain-containing phosphohydrolase, partial [Nitriliruptorales bacterium]
FTRGHSERVRVNVDTLGEELGLSAEDRTKLSWAALVHDIGKLKVAEATLNETEQLSDEQWAELRRHPTLGRRLAAPLGPWLGPWIGAVTEHHERWDGGGYPAGLAGEEISLAGRITAVADTLEVLTAGRAYAPAIRPAAAREELVRCAGTQFDPKVVRAALRLSLGRRTAAAALLSTLAGIPIIGALVRVDRQAWQGAAVAGGLVVAVATGLIAPLARPLQPPPVAAPASGVPASPSDEPTVASPDLPSDGDAGAAPREAQPPSDTAEDGPAPTPTAAPSPTPAPSPAPAGGGEPSAPARHDEPVAGSWYLHPAVPAAHVAHASLPLASREPVTDEPVDADSDRGASPGVGLDDDRPTQGWETAVTSPTVLAGPLSVDVYAANPGLRQGSVELRVTVHRCGQDGACEQIAAGDVRGEAEPGGWTRLSASLEPTVGVLPVAGLLRVDLTRGSAGSEVWVAPASRTTPSAITLPALQPLGVLAVASATSLRHLVGRPAGPSCRDWPRRETTG